MPPIFIMKVIRLVCFEFDVDVDDLFKLKISNNASVARKTIVYILYRDRTPTTIKDMLGLSHMQTVYNSVSWVRDQMALDKKYKKKVEKIIQELKDEGKL
jgi:chromosomal replication initiation ATPase DnaA